MDKKKHKENGRAWAKWMGKKGQRVEKIRACVREVHESASVCFAGWLGRLTAFSISFSSEHVETRFIVIFLFFPFVSLPLLRVSPLFISAFIFVPKRAVQNDWNAASEKLRPNAASSFVNYKARFRRVPRPTWKTVVRNTYSSHRNKLGNAASFSRNSLE